MIECLCPHCKSAIEADEAYAGGIIACPFCHNELKLPDIEEKTEDFGICPKCRPPLRIADAAICIHCGQRLRRVPVDAETKKKRRRLRLRIFFTLLASLVIAYAALFIRPALIGIPLCFIIAGTFPGLWGAMLAKMVRLNASVKTGLLACVWTLLIVFAVYGYIQWNIFDGIMRYKMMYSLLENPENAQNFPDSPLKTETIEVGRKLAAADKNASDYAQFHFSEISKLQKKYETHQFPFRWKLHKLMEWQSQHLLKTVLWLVGLNFINLFCAYFFGKIPGAFSRITDYKIQWDVEIADEENFDMDACGDSRFVMAVAVVVINSLVSSGIFCIFCHIVGKSSWLFLLIIALITMIPAITCLSKCENLKAKAILLGLAAFCAGAVMLILFPW